MTAPVIAAASRLLPARKVIDAHAAEPDGRMINLVTTWGVIRQLDAALQPRTPEGGTPPLAPERGAPIRTPQRAPIRTPDSAPTRNPEQGPRPRTPEA